MASELDLIRRIYDYNSRTRVKYLAAIWKLPPRARYRDRGASYPSLVDIYRTSSMPIGYGSTRSMLAAARPIGTPSGNGSPWRKPVARRGPLTGAFCACSVRCGRMISTGASRFRSGGARASP